LLPVVSCMYGIIKRSFALSLFNFYGLLDWYDCRDSGCQVVVVVVVVVVGNKTSTNSPPKSKNYIISTPPPPCIIPPNEAVYS